MASKKKANAKKKAARRKQSNKTEKEFEDLPPLEDEESKIEEIHDDEPELEVPKSHKPWSSLQWPADKIDRILKQLANSHMLSENSIYEPKDAKDKVVAVIFKNDEPKFPSKIEIGVSGFASTLMFMFSLTRKLCVPMPYWALFHGKKRLSGGEMISSFLKGSDGPVVFTVVQVVDVTEYLSPFEKEAQQKKNASLNKRKLPNDMSTIKKHSIEAFHLKEADIKNANELSQDQWKEYFVKRMALDEQMENFLKKESGEEVEANADNIVTSSKKNALQRLAIKSNQPNANPSEQDKANFQSVLEGIYVWGKELNWEDEDKLSDVSVYSRIYSPFIIGNYLDMHAEGHERSGEHSFDSYGAWSYLLGTIKTPQDTSLVEALENEKPSKIKYLAKSNYDDGRSYEEREVISTKQLMKIQKHLFGDKIKLSPCRFFKFLFAASGVDFVDDYMIPFAGVDRYAKRSFESNLDSEPEEDDKDSNISSDEHDHHGHSHSHGHAHDDDEEYGEYDEDEEYDEDDDFGNMQRNAILSMLMQQAMASEGSHGGHSHSHGGHGGHSHSHGSGRGSHSSHSSSRSQQPPNCPTQ